MDNQNIQALLEHVRDINDNTRYINMLDTDLRRIIVIGPTGSGKTSLVDILSNKEVFIRLIDQCILQIEGDGIGSGRQSITRFPNMQINEGITNILCDFPGHFDSNGFIGELNNAFLINQLFQRINNHDLRIKLLVVISFDDIRSRRCETVEQTFVQIEKMFNNNIGELRNGIGLVITKTRPNMHAEAILNSMKNNTDGILKSWCDYFLQNQCQHVFLFSEPSFEDVDDLYSTFPDKLNLSMIIILILLIHLIQFH